MAHDREVAGLRCFQVLAKLNEYLDGELDVGTKASLERHLADCEVCASFGGHMGELVRRLKADLASDGVLEAETAARLRAALSRALG